LLSQRWVPSHPLRFPPTVLQPDALLPSTGSHQVKFPCFFSTIRALRLLAVHLTALRFLRLAIPFTADVPLYSLLSGFRTLQPSGQGFLPLGDPPPISTAWRQRDLPSSCAPLPRICPALRPRQDLHVRPSQRFGTVPVPLTTKTPAFGLSRLNHTAFAITVHASRPWSPMVAQDSFPTAGQALSGWISSQQGRYERFQLTSSFHKLSLAR